MPAVADLAGRATSDVTGRNPGLLNLYLTRAVPITTPLGPVK